MFFYWCLVAWKVSHLLKGTRSSVNSVPLLITVVWLFTAGVGLAETKLGEETTVVFATVDQGREILTTRDDFVRRLSPFDRQARLKTDRAVTEAEYLAFVGNHVLAWSDDERETVESALAL